MNTHLYYNLDVCKISEMNVLSYPIKEKKYQRGVLNSALRYFQETNLKHKVIESLKRKGEKILNIYKVNTQKNTQLY